MKRFHTLSLLGVFFFASIPASLEAQVRETPVTIGLVQGGNPQGYIQGSNEQGIAFATAPGGTAQMVEYSKIRGEGLEKAIRFEERVEVLGTPRALFSEGRYEEAAEAFGQVARSYSIILAIPENFALEAFFYEAESLRRAGNYDKLATIMALPVAASIENLLGERYQETYDFLQLWGLYGVGDMGKLEAALEVYQEPAVGDAKLLATPNFKAMPGSDIAQLAFLRAKVFDSKSEKMKALDDYYRAFTLGYGNNADLAENAMKSAMAIHQADPAMAEEASPVQKQVQALAYLYSKRFDVADLPAELQSMATRPATSNPLKTAPAEEEAPAEDAAPEPEGDAPSADGGDDSAKGGKGKMEKEGE